MSGQTTTARQLDWQETFIDRGDGHQDPKGFEAETAFGHWYRIEQYFGSDSYGWQVEYDHIIIGDFDDPDRAQACAQGHFEKCIRASLADDELDALKHDIERHQQIISDMLAERDGLVKALEMAIGVLVEYAGTTEQPTIKSLLAALSSAKEGTR